MKDFNNSILATPSELLFSKESTKQIITIKNENDKPLAFKVKTTSQKTFSVKPNVGVVPKGQSCEITILLNTSDVFEDQRKDKFLIQCVLLASDQENTSELWAKVDSKTAGLKLFEQKIRCVFMNGQHPSSIKDTDDNASVYRDNEDRPSLSVSDCILFLRSRAKL